MQYCQWIVDPATESPLAVIEDTPNGLGVVEIGKRNTKNIAKAHLIAAAPELLEALKLAIIVMQDNSIDESMAGEFEMFTDAIAKAKGSNI